MSSKLTADEEYILAHGLHTLFEKMLQELVIHKPADPLQFLISFVSKSEVPKVIVIGPPKSGKTTQCKLLSKELGAVIVDEKSCVEAAIAKGSEKGTDAQTYISKNIPIPEHVLASIIHERLLETDCIENGWVLDGYPRTADQAMALKRCGVIPSQVVQLELSKEEIARRTPKESSSDDVWRRYDEYCSNSLRVGHSFPNVVRFFDATQAIEKIHADIRSFALGFSTAPKFIILGPPASGKGTQCETIKARFGVVHLSTGEMLRDHVSKGTSLGRRVKPFMERGELVPDELVIEILSDRMQSADCKSRGWLLDGFPRTAAQAAYLLQQKVYPDSVIYLDISESTAVERISGRRIDPTTGISYHVTYDPPPADIASRVIQRADDTEQAVTVRFRDYKANLKGIESAFAKLNTIRVNAAESKQKISASILAHVRGERQSSLRCAVIGAMGCGKTTQSNEIALRYECVHVKPEEVISDNIERKTKYGKRAQECIDSGRKPMGDIVCSMVIEKLLSPECLTKGWVLDGFPTTAEQARQLSEAAVFPNKLILLDIDDKSICDAIIQRRAMYAPIDDESGEATNGIDKATQELVTVRSAVAFFRKHSNEIIAFYKQSFGANTAGWDSFMSTVSADNLLPMVSSDVFRSLRN